MLFQLIGGRNCYRTQLVQSQHGKPELIMPLQNQHDLIALLDSQGLKIVCCLVGGILHIPEGEPMLTLILADVKHGQLFRLFTAQSINNIKGEVELILTLKRNSSQNTLLVFHRFHKFLPNPGNLNSFLFDGSQIHIPAAGMDNMFHGFAGGIQNKRIECTIRILYSHHTMGYGAVIINAVTGMQNFNVITHLDLQRTFDNNITFLTLVGGQLNVGVLGLGIKFRDNIKRFCNSVFKGSSQVKIGHAVGLLNLLTLTASGHGITSQTRAGTLNNIRNVNV